MRLTIRQTIDKNRRTILNRLTESSDDSRQSSDDRRKSSDDFRNRLTIFVNRLTIPILEEILKGFLGV